MVNILGQEIPVSLDISGFISSSWIWVFIVFIIGVILVTGIGLLLFFRTYNRKIIVFDNIAGRGYQVAFRSRARIIKLGAGGEEILKTLFGGYYVSAYGRKMAKNQYWYAKGPDGYWYNFVLADLDTKNGILDIEPVEKDVRMQHVAIGNMARAQYDKKNTMEKWVFGLFLLFMIIIFFVGMYVTWGRIGDATAPLAQANDNAAKISESNARTTEILANIANRLGISPTPTTEGVGGSGLVPAT